MSSHTRTDAEELESLLSRVVEDLWSQAGRVGPDIKAVQDVAMTALAGGIVDDRKYIVVATSLPNDSQLRDDLSGQFIKTLWNGLKHPPISYLGEFKYRAADGSNNNILYPNLGAAGSHYARSVVPQHMKPAILPDPSIIFDTILARQEFKEHPSKISSTLFYFATIIIHDIFHTDEQDSTRLKNSSYLDLGPLYGHNENQQRLVRTYKDGLLKNDTFAESRLLGQPPGVCAFMIAFNRFHNYIVGELAIINEGNRFSIPKEVNPQSPGYEAAQLKRDNDFITSGLYVNIILNDYLRAILNLNQNTIDSNWTLDPRKNFDNVFDAAGIPSGIGNQVSAEFNMIYRWHAATSAHDEAWVKDFMKKVFGPDVDPNRLKLPQFLAGLATWAQGLPADPAQYVFGGLKRQSDGSFEDSELVELLRSGTENVAGAFGARNIPSVMKAIEILGIETGRQWNLASLNEVRLFFKLKPHATFLEVNSDPAVADALQSLYDTPDDIELYPGLQAEEGKQPFLPGSGLCPGFTIGTAILSDAVALVRGDRFYAVDYSPANLTNFGFNAVSSSFDVANGGVMYKLLMRAFPGWHRANSVYALFPFTTPDKNREILTKQGKASSYSYDPPSFVAPPVPVLSWQGVVDVLSNQTNFKVPWGNHTFQLTHHDYMLSGDSAANGQQRNFVKGCLFKPQNALDEVRKFYEAITTSLVRRYSRKIGDSYQIDVVREYIGNLAHANFTGHFFGVPLKGFDGGKDSYTDQELYDSLSQIFAYVFLDLDTATSFQHSVTATKATKKLGDAMTPSVTAVKNGNLSIFKHMMDIVPTETVLKDYGSHLIDRLFEGGKSIDEVMWAIIPTAAAACATQAQGWAQLIDLYLSDNYISHWPAIQKLANSEAPEDFEKLKKYALEGLRLATPAFGVLRGNTYCSLTTSCPYVPILRCVDLTDFIYPVVDVPEADITDGPRVIPVKEGDTIFADFVSAGLDSTKFPDPTEIKLDRPDEDYIHHGWGPHACLGRPIVTTAAASMLRVFARLGNLRKAPGPAGEITNKVVNGAFKVFLLPDGSDWGSFPNSKKVLFDDFASP
ncbi:9,12-octadecadienoate 8-hydroperoxide 8R-isomerase [Hyphodiscus hymeniophilus]|uniref:9,12-octadecadienoate 8-hydroperoxide 8R-isomerase n=1 Tax=Hyphodiscus hymeniophilus TaxID=353542 RepID=A0A9P6VR17_9HELO|nr:9,12-octadecadienoate 8-hydroperoxide 8R-isomerase [Hyphodiscus hymeniophilus]